MNDVISELSYKLYFLCSFLKNINNNLFQKLSNTMHILNEIRNRQDFVLDVMVARQFPNDGQSDLHYLNSLGNYDQ